MLGIGAQWLAWRIKIPSILLLLLVGFVAGPVTGFLSPESLSGEWLYAFVSLAIGVILFEGGLSLRVSDLQEIGRSVVSLITVGVLITWLLCALAAYYILDFTPEMALQLGAILTVTGPTVVIPLLRHVRPSGKVATIARWEGITIDPVGAILAVLVLEGILLSYGAAHESLADTFFEALLGLFKVFFVSIGLSITGAAIAVVVLRRWLVPDYLLNSVALMLVIGFFELSNVLQAESGLLTVTLMGIMLANQKLVSVRRISEFKEDLQVLLIACLFILLSARIEPGALSFITARAWIFLLVVIVLIRPIAVWASLRGTVLDWKERAFLAWLAPRGIVAAAVASLFSFRLEEVLGIDVVAPLVPITFLVIVGTVAVYGLTLSPWARYLGLASPSPQGVLILGGHGWAMEIAKLLQKLEFKVLVIDSNPGNVEIARRAGLEAEQANALSETVVDELDLGGIGRLLALTRNDEVNSLAALHFREVFETNGVYQLQSRSGQKRHLVSELPMHLRGRPLFSENTDYASLTLRYEKGGKIKAITLKPDLTYDHVVEEYEQDVIPLLWIRGHQLTILTELENFQPEIGDTVIVFTPPTAGEDDLFDYKDIFDRAVERSLVLDLEEASSFKEIVKQAAAMLSQRLPVSADHLARGFLEGARYGASPLTRSIALPHLRLPDIKIAELLLVRCQDGVSIHFEDLHFDRKKKNAPEGNSRANLVTTFIFLVSPENRPRLHLRFLSEIVKRIDADDFVTAWNKASSDDELRNALRTGGGEQLARNEGVDAK